MKILFFSDIHGIYKNLNYLISLDKKIYFDKVICLGDLYSYGINSDLKHYISNEHVYGFLNSFKDRLICMKGNNDFNSNIKQFDKYYKLEVDGLNMFISHGNIYNMYNNYDYFKDNILIYGHEHIPYIRFFNNTYFINVGSISLPRGESNYSFGIYNNYIFYLYDIDGNIIDKCNFKEEINDD